MSVRLRRWIRRPRLRRVAPEGSRSAPVHTGGVSGLTDRAGVAGEIHRTAVDGTFTGVVVFVAIDRLETLERLLGPGARSCVLEVLAGRLLDGEVGTLGLFRSGLFAIVRTGEQAAWTVDGAELIARVEQPMLVNGVEVRVSGAVIVTPFHATAVPTAERALEIVRLAETRARAHHRTGIGPTTAPYRDALPGVVDDLILTQLRSAVTAGSIVARYQPILDLETGEVVGAEALARWPRSPNAEVEAPDRFLAIADAIGLRRTISDQLLDQVCRDFSRGEAAESGLWVAVNLSEGELLSPDIVARVQQCLARSGVDPARLVVEVSERLIPSPAAVRAVEQLSALGVRMAIDDFGSGWSSLAQLTRLPADIIKVDRSLLQDPAGPRSEILEATVAMSRALGRTVLVEGIETEVQLDRCLDAGATLGQGFLWCPAVTLDQLLAHAGSRSTAPRHDDRRRAWPAREDGW